MLNPMQAYRPRPNMFGISSWGIPLPLSYMRQVITFNLTTKLRNCLKSLKLCKANRIEWASTKLEQDGEDTGCNESYFTSYSIIHCLTTLNGLSDLLLSHFLPKSSFLCLDLLNTSFFGKSFLKNKKCTRP